MDIGQNRAAASRIFDQAWNQADYTGMDEIIAEDASFHFRNQSYPTNARDLVRIINGWHQSFADFHFSIEDIVAEGDLVALRLIMSGIHQDQWKGIPATGKLIQTTAMFFLRFEAGKAVEIWEDYDEYGIRQQITE